MLKTASSLEELEKSLPRRLAVSAMLGWLISFAVISSIVYIGERAAGWPTWFGAGAFAATFAGPYFGGCAAIARHQTAVETAQRQTGTTSIP